jgi:4-amino-4-deoxy-L-arabinose transferase-like glycosyltransferase
VTISGQPFASIPLRASAAPGRPPNAAADNVVQRSESHDRQLQSFVLTRRQVRALLAIILAVGLLLRVHDYTAAPRLRENVDELAWAWAGLSLLQDHSPTSWSYLPAYPRTFPLREPDNGRILPGVHPWLDHPPLFALLVGGFAWIAGERQFSQVTAGVIRVPVMFLSLLTLLLVYLLGRRLLGTLPSLLGAGLFAVSPGAVLGSRQVESEALLAPMLLLTLLLLHRVLEGEAGRYTVPALMLLCGLAPLVKVPGASFGLIVAAVLAMARRRRLAWLAAAMSCLGLLAWSGYGLLVDWKTFLAVTWAQADRHSGLLGGYEFIVSPAGFSDSVRLHDGWWVLGWLSLVVLAFLHRARRADLLLGWPIAGYALAVMLISDMNVAGRYGWYRFTIYPLVYLVAADLVVAAVARPTLVRGMLVIALPGAAATLAWVGSAGAWNPPLLLELVPLALVVAGSVFANLHLRRGRGWRCWWPQLAVGATVALIILLDVAQSFRLASIYTSL